METKPTTRDLFVFPGRAQQDLPELEIVIKITRKKNMHNPEASATDILSMILQGGTKKIEKTHITIYAASLIADPSQKYRTPTAFPVYREHTTTSRPGK
jgi:hypothetical protein